MYSGITGMFISENLCVLTNVGPTPAHPVLKA